MFGSSEQLVIILIFPPFLHFLAAFYVIVHLFWNNSRGSLYSYNKPGSESDVDQDLWVRPFEMPLAVY